VYIIGSAAGIRLLGDKGWQRIFPWISLILSLVLLPFVGIAALGSILAGLAAFAYVRYKIRLGTSLTSGAGEIRGSNKNYFNQR
jgi:amino acid efflux transporter